MSYTIDYMGGACPTQAEGKWDGRPFYFRARYGEWAFWVAEGDDPEPLHGICTARGDDPTNGCMTDDEVHSILRQLCGEFTPTTADRT